jgi:hypothetical protein
LGALGGALGLYTGFCGVTLFEIFELFILLLLALVGWNFNATQGDDGNDSGIIATTDNKGKIVGNTSLPSGRKVAPANDMLLSKSLRGLDNPREALVRWKRNPGVFVPADVPSTFEY